MALTAEQIQQIAAGQGGGQTLFNLVGSGGVNMADVTAALGQSAVDQWLARTGNAAPTGLNQQPTQTSTATAPKPPTLSVTGYASGTSTAPPGSAGNGAAPAGNAGGYLNTQVPGGTTTNTDYTRYPTPIPNAPNYEAAANQQGEANLNAAKNTVALSNVNQFNPFGSQTYTIGPDGRPVQTQNFSVGQQQRLSDLDSILPSVTNNIRNNTGRDLGSYDFQNIMDLDNVSLPQRTTQAGEAGISSVAEALRAREAPRMERARKQNEADLLARGFNPGTEGYTERMDEVSRAENDFNLGLSALAGQEQSRLFNLDTENRNTRRAELNDLFGAQMAKRQGQVGEAITARTLPIQEYGSLVSAMTPQMPQFNQYQGAQVQANPIFDATNAKGLFDLGRYGTSVQGELGSRGINTGASDSNKSAGASIVGAALGAMALMSDIRLKTNIQWLGTSDTGFNLYSWNWTDEGRSLAGNQPEFGVIAQEVALTNPEAVVLGDDGYMRVDYRRVL